MSALGRDAGYAFRTVPHDVLDTYTPFLTTMLARQAFTRAAQPALARAAPAGARNMATLREIEMRLKSVRNIEKITKVRRVQQPHARAQLKYDASHTCSR